MRPGEATLAHRGVLFLDEMTEFSPAVLDVLREPMEEGRITIVRGPGARSYPADFQLVGAMNPCRCGFRGSTERECRCTATEQTRYWGRLSGPLLDRFDLFVEVGGWQGRILRPSRRSAETTAGRGTGFRDRGDGDWRIWPTSEVIQSARDRLAENGREKKGRLSEIPTDDMESEAVDFLEESRRPLGLSLRGMIRCMDVARTIAALDGSEAVGTAQVREALEFRQGILNLDSY